MRRPNRSWGARGAWRAWGAWRTFLSRSPLSSCLARGSWGPLWTWWASHARWASAPGVSLGTCGAREPPAAKLVFLGEQGAPGTLSRSREPSEASIPRAALGSRRAPEWGWVLEGLRSVGHRPLHRRQLCHLGLQHLQPLCQLCDLAAVETACEGRGPECHPPHGGACPAGLHEARGACNFLAAGARVPGAAPPLSGRHGLVHHLVRGPHHSPVATPGAAHGPGAALQHSLEEGAILHVARDSAGHHIGAPVPSAASAQTKSSAGKQSLPSCL